ncbi:MAG: hypothetical protein ACKVGY_02960, partial [Candidatus Poseidoniales archaeon]
DNPYGSNEIKQINDTLIQLKKLRKDMKKWFKNKEDELEDKKDMKIETREFLDEINSILMETLEINENENFAIMRRMINQLFQVKVDSDDSIES